MYSLTPSVLNRFANTLAALCVHWWWMSLQLLFNFSQKLLCLWQKVSLSIPPFHPLKSMPSFAKVTHNLFSYEDWATMPGPPMQGRFIFKSDALSYTISHCDDWMQVGTECLNVKQNLRLCSICSSILSRKLKMTAKRRPMAWRIHKRERQNILIISHGTSISFPPTMRPGKKKGKSLKADIKLFACGCWDIL